MANVSPGKNSKRNFNVDLNLVPFIDLLSTLVLFLLVTTVWMQVSMLPIGVGVKSSPSVGTNQPSKPLARVELRVTPTEMQLKWPATITAFPKAVARTNESENLSEIQKILSSARKDFPELTAAVSAEQTVSYGLVVRTIDTARTAGLSSVGLAME